MVVTCLFKICVKEAKNCFVLWWIACTSCHLFINESTAPLNLCIMLAILVTLHSELFWNEVRILSVSCKVLLYLCVVMFSPFRRETKTVKFASFFRGFLLSIYYIHTRLQIYYDSLQHGAWTCWHNPLLFAGHQGGSDQLGVASPILHDTT